MRQLKLAVRMLLRTPFVTAVAVLSLALGIGANAASFSLFHEVLMQRLPVAEPNRLVNLGAPGPKSGSWCGLAGDCADVFSYPMYKDLKREQKSFTDIAAHSDFGASLLTNGVVGTAAGLLVSGSYFPVLGIKAEVGRLLAPSDDEVIGANFVAVLSYEFWQERFGRDRGAVGQNITVNGKSFQIVGVAQKRFRGTTLGSRPVVFLPLTMREVITTGAPAFERRQAYWAFLFGRLKHGVSIEQARTDLNTTYNRILREVEAPLQRDLDEKGMAAFKARKLTMVPGHRGQSVLGREAKTPLLLLGGITGIVLLIACANIATLLLARGANRATEMGVRLALGASRRQLMSQLLIESVLLSAVGGLFSLLFAQWTMDVIGALFPPEDATVFSLGLRWPVVFFAAGMSVVTGLIFGMFPALHSTRSDLVTMIRAGATQITGGKAAGRFRTVLVTVQIALSTMLLISAGLFTKSLFNVSRINVGMNVESFVTFMLNPERNAYDGTRSGQLFERVEREMAAIPGVTAVVSSVAPLPSGSSGSTSLHVQGRPEGPEGENNSRYSEIGAGYMSALGVPVLSGREFTESDRLGSAKVALVNESFARKFNLGTDPVGKFISDRGPGSPDIQIVGLVRDTRYTSVMDAPVSFLYRPWRQKPATGFLSFYVRSSLPAEQLLRAIPDVMKQIDPTLPVERLKTLPQAIKEEIFLERMYSILTTAFALLATLLAAIGLYGVLAYSVAQRTREIGIRMALGADSGHVRQLVMRQLGVMLLAGGTVGIAAALGLGRVVQSLLYGMQGHDPIVFVLAVVLLASIAVLAAYLPARRASLVDPMHALRYD